MKINEKTQENNHDPSCGAPWLTVSSEQNGHPLQNVCRHTPGLGRFSSAPPRPAQWRILNLICPIHPKGGCMMSSALQASCLVSRIDACIGGNCYLCRHKNDEKANRKNFRSNEKSCEPRSLPRPRTPAKIQRRFPPQTSKIVDFRFESGSEGKPR